MRHEHLTGSLVELREIRKTSSRADGVLHHPPEAFDGVEVVTTMGRQEMQAKLSAVVVKCRVKLVRPMDPAAIDDHHDVLASCAEGRHHLMDILAQLLGIKVRHDFIEDAGGAVLHGANDRQQHAAGDAAPGTITQPGLTFEALLPFDLALAQRPCGEAGALGASPPARPEHGKAPQDRFIFVESNDLAPASPVLQGGKFQSTISEVSGIGIEPSGGAAGA
jgi:hypothetical protein